ncbi:unnamed protein product, partial [Candidula unifasciata]
LTMSQSVNKPPPSGRPEAQAFTAIKFHVQQSNGNFLIQEADCLVTSLIRGLKEDLSRQLGPPDSQNWFYQGRLMSDNEKLRDYGINGEDEADIEVKPF